MEIAFQVKVKCVLSVALLAKCIRLSQWSSGEAEVWGGFRITLAQKVYQFIFSTSGCVFNLSTLLCWVIVFDHTFQLCSLFYFL